MYKKKEDFAAASSFSEMDSSFAVSVIWRILR
jgi:hypothetical protein